MGLADDIYKNVLGGDYIISKEDAAAFGKSMENLLLERFNGKERTPGISGSNYGTACNRKMWHKINEDDKCERVDPQLRLKFLYGDLVEELLLFLIEASGHEVEGKQDRLSMGELQGSRDCVVDGVTVDIKSASGFGIRKFKFHDLADRDPFSYLPQVSFYRWADEQVQEGGAFVVIDKVSGEIVVDYYDDSELYSKDEVVAGFEDIKAAVEQEYPPEREYEPKELSYGNLALSTECRYCNAKWASHPGLKAFNYSRGPEYIVHLEKRPKDSIADITRKELEKGGLL